MKNISSEITVSVCCITYNHEKYIAQALEGFLMQKTNFAFEILIGEDCSTDKTRQIIETYRQKYPQLIKVISGKTNIGGLKNLIHVIANAKGKYFAFCDGDDFWTDANKLQKQVDFLEQNRNFVACGHYSKVINDIDETIYLAKELVPLEYTYDDFLIGRKEETRMASLMFKATKTFKKLGENNWYYNISAGDNFLKLYITSTSGGKLYVMPEVMSCYRIHQGGIWSMIDPKIRRRKKISDFNLLINNFKYSSFQKRALLKIYFRKYFLFQLADFKIKNAYQTITQLI